jgi:diacylglycerol kinase family enzyme
VWNNIGDETNKLVGYFRSYTTSFTSVQVMEQENEKVVKQSDKKWHYSVYAAGSDGTLNKLVDQKN